MWSYWWKVAISLDQLGNVVGSDFLTDTMTGGSGYRFGNEDETISYVIAINRDKGTLTLFGKFWAGFLEFVDPEHLNTAIKNKE